MLRRSLQSFLLLFKEDLKISGICQGIRDNISGSLSKDSPFSAELTKYFADDVLPASVNDTDPSQVALLKKVINALYNAEEAFRKIETIDFSTDRSELGLIYNLAKEASGLVHQLYGVVQDVNHCSQDIQAIIGPDFFNALLPAINRVATGLQKLTVTGAKELTPEHAGEFIASAVNRLPAVKTENMGLSHLSTALYQLPHYFEEMHKVIATGDSKYLLEDTTSSKEYQKILQERTDKARQQFEILTSESGFFNLLPTSLSTIKLLLSTGSDLMGTAAPLTKEAYKLASQKLNELRHNHLPNMISELEALEEKMSLKPGTLTDPIIKQVDSYYKQLALQVNGLANAINGTGDVMDSWYGKLARKIIGDDVVIGAESKIDVIMDLDIMRDDEYNQIIKHKQVTRLTEARFGQKITRQIEAAERFFNTLDKYFEFDNPTQSIDDLESDIKTALLDDYRKFQHHFATIHPDIDKILTDALATNKESGWLAKVGSQAYKLLWASNQFKLVEDCRESVLATIQQSESQSQFNANLVQHSITHDEKRMSQANQEKTPLNETVKPFAPLEYDSKKNQSKKNDTPDFYHQKKLAFAVQLHKIEEAKSASQAFFNKLETAPLSKFTGVEREALRKEFKKFQPFLPSPQFDNLGRQIAQALNTDTQGLDPLPASDLPALQNTMDAVITEHITLSINAVSDYAALENEALEKLPVVAIGAALERKTLFGQVSDLKLSDKINGLELKFKQFLENNVEPAVLDKLLLDNLGVFDERSAFTKFFDSFVSAGTNPVINEFHRDSDEVILYHKLINALYLLKMTFKDLEQVDGLGDPQGLINRGRFAAGAVLPLLTSFLSAKANLGNAISNPAIGAIVNEAIKILEPLKSIPGIGSYFQIPTSSVPTSEEDMIRQWELQQELVARGLDPSPEGCGFLKISDDFVPNKGYEHDTLFRRLLKGKNAVVSFRDKLFYADQRTGKMTEIPEIKRVEPSLFNFYRGTESNEVAWSSLKNKCKETLTMADKSFLDVIKNVTGRSHKESQKIVPTAETAEKSDIILIKMSSVPTIKTIYALPNDGTTGAYVRVKNNLYFIQIPDKITKISVNKKTREAFDSAFNPQEFDEKNIGANLKQIHLLKKDVGELTRLTGHKIPTESMLEIFAKNLYKIPAKIADLNPGNKLTELQKYKRNIDLEKQIEAFVDGLSKLPLRPDSLKKILTAVNEIDNQISSAGANSREFIHSQLKNIHTELGGAIVILADNTEFNLGLKAGTLSTPVHKAFDDFYGSLVIHLDLKGEKKAQNLYLDRGLTDNRIKNETIRLSELKKSDEAEQYQAHIFGSEDKSSPGSFNALENMQESMMENDAEEAHELWDDYASEDKNDLFFNDKKHQKEFLEIYAELRPYLKQIDLRYNDASNLGFLRELQTADDFKAALNQIISLKPKLQELIAGRQDAKNMKIARCEARIEFLKQQQSHEAVEKFKELAFNDFLDGIKKKTSPELGRFNQAWFQKLASGFEAMKENILNNVTSDNDIKNDVKAKALAMESPVAETLKPLREAYIRLNNLLNNIESRIKTELQKPDMRDQNNQNPIRRLKIEALQAISADIIQQIEKVNVIGDDVAMLNNLAETTPDRLKSVDIYNKIMQMKELQFITEHLSLEKAEHLKNPLPNPLRTQKIQMLEQFQDMYKQPGYLTETGQPETVKAAAQKIIANAAVYDHLIAAHDGLIAIKTYVVNEKGPFMSKKLTEIKRLEDHLLNPAKIDPRQRLDTTIRRAIGDPECQHILLENADNVLIRLLKSFWSALTGWKSTSEMTFASFKNRLPKQDAASLSGEHSLDAGNGHPEPVQKNAAAPDCNKKDQNSQEFINSGAGYPK